MFEKISDETLEALAKTLPPLPTDRVQLRRHALANDFLVFEGRDPQYFTATSMTKRRTIVMRFDENEKIISASASTWGESYGLSDFREDERSLGFATGSDAALLANEWLRGQH